MRVFVLYWKDGTKEVVEGVGFTDAFSTKHPPEDILKLDFYSANDYYEWDDEDKKWVEKSDGILL